MRRNQPEAQLQRAVFEHIGWRAVPGTFAFHPANGGLRSKAEASILRGLGVRAGLPDVVCFRAGLAPVCIELKRPSSARSPAGRLSPAQLECHEALKRAGVIVAVADNIDSALDLLISWGVLRATNSHRPVRINPSNQQRANEHE